MPKLRNASTDIGGFAQWLGRKCRNHNPLKELGMANRHNLPSRYKEKTHGDVHVVNADSDTPGVLYRAGGRAFMLELREIPIEETEGMKLEAVGY